MNGNAKNAQRQGQQPNEGIDHERKQSDGPAQDKQNAPQEKSSHGNLIGEPSTLTETKIAKLPPFKYNYDVEA